MCLRRWLHDRYARRAAALSTLHELVTSGVAYALHWALAFELRRRTCSGSRCSSDWLARRHEPSGRIRPRGPGKRGHRGHTMRSRPWVRLRSPIIVAMATSRRGGLILVHRLLAAPAAGPRHLPRVRTPPHPPGAVHRRAAGRRRAAHAARTAHRRTAGASAALRAVRRLLPVPGWRGTAGRPRVSAHGRRACRKAGAKRGPRRDGDTRLIESRIVLELQSARGIRSAYGSIGT